MAIENVRVFINIYINRLGNDASCAQREETRYQQTKRSNQEGGCH